MQLTIELKQPKAEHDSFVEFVRLSDGKYLFDEVLVKEFKFGPFGIDVSLSYIRNGVKLDTLVQTTIPPREFAEARTAAKGDHAVFAKSRVVERLFAEGARAWHDAHRAVEEDYLKDMEFIDSFKDSDPS